MQFELAPFHKEVLNGVISDLKMLLNDADPITGDKLEERHRKVLLIGSANILAAIWNNIVKFDFDTEELTATEAAAIENNFYATLRNVVDASKRIA